MTEAPTLKQRSHATIERDLLHALNVTPATQRPHLAFYAAMFRGRQRVVDLGCGSGIFVEMLKEEGGDVRGVDRDSANVADARARGLPVEEIDAFAFLAREPAGSLDGLFASHLVEHLLPEKVLDLFEASARVLKPGGILVVSTPNVRALIGHLDLFYLAFSHTRFYHPELLSFLLRRAGFTTVEAGEHPHPPLPYLGHALPEFLPVIRLPKFPLRFPWWEKFRETFRILRENTVRYRQMVERIDRPAECYVTGRR